MAEELWAEVKGYDGRYIVSNFGNVKSVERDVLGKNNIVKHHKGKDLKQFFRHRGYHTVYLTKCGKTKKYYVHRLVAEAFIPNPGNLPQINHKDENKINNYVENLEWCTAQYNALYGTRLERRSKTLAKTFKSPEFRKKMSEISRNAWDDPEYRKRREKTYHLCSKRLKKRWEDPEFRERMIELARTNGKNYGRGRKAVSE